LSYIQSFRKLYTPKGYEEIVDQEAVVIFSAEKHSELKSGLSANLGRRSSNRYVAGVILLLLSTLLYTMIPHPLQGQERVMMMCWAKLHCANFMWEKQSFVNTGFAY
jgi:hypothetical protein